MGSDRSPAEFRAVIAQAEQLAAPLAHPNDPKFALPLPTIEELQRQTGTGILALSRSIIGFGCGIKEIHQTIRLALIGGGTEAQQRGITLSPQQRAELKQLAEGMAEVETATKKASATQEQMQATQQFLKRGVRASSRTPSPDRQASNRR